MACGSWRRRACKPASRWRAESTSASARQRLAGLQALRRHDPRANSQLPAAESELAELTEQLTRHREEAARLILHAPVAGVLLAPPRTTSTQEETTLATWSGSPLETKNLGAWITPGTLIALIASSESSEVMVAIDERDIERVEPGQAVRVQLAQLGGRVIEAQVEEIAHRGRNVRSTDPQTLGLAHFLPHPLEPTARTARYEARLTPTPPLTGVMLDGGGRAKIETGRTPLGGWLLRELRDTFRLP